jgi:hypothetical protein
MKSMMCRIWLYSSSIRMMRDLVSDQFPNTEPSLAVPSCLPKVLSDSTGFVRLELYL